ncbi:nectin 1a isoform X1 [Brachyhypopomus gauderio]|uniref:nectin 1a isoform X1 n=1 Tax=Brachyhypopomus gauderio TaxID=698409 RepID=UPI0040419D07
MTLAVPLFFGLLLSGGSGQLVQMDSDMSGYVGSQVELRCSFINSNPPVKISQVTWQRLLNGTKQNVAIANPTLGVSVLSPFRDRVRFKSPAVRRRTPSLEDTTIVLNNLRLTDEAAYICEYTTFPAGNRENMVNLTVYARPMVRTTLSKPIIVVGPKAQKMTVATCISANGKPASVITWESDLNGEGDTKEVLNADGTITVRSDYMVVPSRATHQQQLTCVSTYNDDQYTDSVTLNVQYEPEVIIEGFDGDWYINRENVQLTCLADANPAVSFFQWRYLNGTMPKDAELREDSLIFKGAVGYELAGTYVCDATNSVGTGSASVEVTVTEFPSLSHGVSQEQQRAGAAIAGAVVCAMVLLAALTLLAVFINHQRRTFKGDYNTKKQVLGNGFSKAGSLQSLPSLPQSLSYPLGDEKKSEPHGGLRLDERIQEFHMYPEHGMKAYSSVVENKAFRYGERSYLYNYGAEMEISVDMVPQMDGSVISKEEWYV